MDVGAGEKSFHKSIMVNGYDKNQFEELYGVKPGSNIAVTGTGKLLGTSLFSVMLAGFLANLGFDVCYTECGVPKSKSALLFDSYAMDQRFAGKDFIDFYNELSREGRVLGKSNIEKIPFVRKGRRDLIQEKLDRKKKSGNFGSIDWRLISDANVIDGIELDKRQFSRLESAARGDYNIFDIDSSESFNFMFNDMDLIFVVASPMPSRMIRETERIKTLKLLAGNMRVVWVVNHMNGGVSKREIRKIFRTDKMLFIEEIPAEILYSCEYKCTYPWENEVCRDVFWETFTKVSLR